MIDHQQTITNWFDETYERRGFEYLRPKEAYSIFHTILNPRNNARVLDVGCGLGLLLSAFQQRQNLRLSGVDISNQAISQSRQMCPSADLRLANAEALPFENNSFDFITCIGSLERMINRDLALREMYRVGTDAAQYCIMVRNDQHFIWKYFLKPFKLTNQKGHQDAMSRARWESLFVDNGFKVLNIFPDHWPWYRTIKTVMFWNKPDTSKVIRFPGNVNLAYEFIFHLSKA